MTEHQFPQITVNGEPVSEDRIDPAVAQFVMQAAQTAQLVKLRKLEESKVPTGTKPISRTIPDTVTKFSLYPPWISFSLINDGAGDISVWVNDEGDPLTPSMVLSGESFSLDMTYPVIKELYLKAASGTTAAVRIFAVEGQEAPPYGR